MPERQEIGHNYLNTLRTGSISHIGVQDVIVPRELAGAVELGFNHNALAKSRGVYMGGRVYDSQAGSSDETIYSKISTWREEIGDIVKDNGFVPLHGLDVDLHDQDVAAGAGKAYLGMFCSPIHIVEARGRMGAATIEEAVHSLRLGHSIGLIMAEENYEEAHAFLSGNTKATPRSLPAYWQLLEVESDNLINGTDGLPDWLQNEKRDLHARSLKHRTPDGKALGLIMHYVFSREGNQIEDRTGFKNVLGKL